MYYSRARLGATGKIAFAKDNAIKFFKGGNFPEARKFAADVLNMMQDNAAAQFWLRTAMSFAKVFRVR